LDLARVPEDLIMHAFFAPALAAPGQTVPLARDELQHLRARRIRLGEAVRLIDGRGGYAEGVYDGAAGVTLRAAGTEPEPAVTLVVVQAALPSDTLDWALEKSVEAGAHAIIVFEPARSALGKRPADRTERWVRLTREACKQCGRARFPAVTAAPNLAAALASAQCDRLWLADGAGAAPAFGPPPRRAGLIVGPEGGLDDAERAAAASAGAVKVSLGPWVLRSETVAALGLALLQYGYGRTLATP
jgi:16S rRNA (uracil1498-N3)-methyltransferase